MSIRFRIIQTPANTTLAQADIPDTALAELQAAFVDADGYMAWLVRATREETRQRVYNKARGTADATAAAAAKARETAFDGAWPG